MCIGEDPAPFLGDQPPETAGSIIISSPDTSAVSSPTRSRMCSVFTNTLMCRLTASVSSQMLKYNDGCRFSSSPRAARTVGAQKMSSLAPSQYERSARGTWTVMDIDSDMAIDSAMSNSNVSAHFDELFGFLVDAIP